VSTLRLSEESVKSTKATPIAGSNLSHAALRNDDSFAGLLMRGVSITSRVPPQIQEIRRPTNVLKPTMRMPRSSTAMTLRNQLSKPPEEIICAPRDEGDVDSIYSPYEVRKMKMMR